MALDVSSQMLAVLAFETGSHLALNSSLQLGSLASDPQRSFCLCLPTSGITRVGY